MNEKAVHPVKKLVFEYLKTIDSSEIAKHVRQNTTPRLISKILNYCLPDVFEMGGNTQENLAVLATSMLHFMLTNAFIPSQRKITYNGLELDIVIPNLNTLKANPQNCIIIVMPQIMDKEQIYTKINKVRKIQPDHDKIWIILDEDLETDCKKYIIKKDLPTIIEDIKQTLDLTKQTKLSVFRA